MAANYEVIAQQTVTEVSPANTIQDVNEVTAQAKPSGAVFHVRFPPAINNPTAIGEILSEWANQYNALDAVDNVLGVNTYQDIDNQNQLVDVTQVTVNSSSGKSTSVLTFPNFSYVNDAIVNAIHNEAVRLNDVEAL